MAYKRILIAGGGAAGYFAAITAAEHNPESRVVIAESGDRPLRKVAVSGGGRCNVTHACFEPAELVGCYPRGYRELRGPFARFQPRDTIQWFEQRGAALKTESDGRVFPVSDDSKTIIDCLERARGELKITLRLSTKVTGLKQLSDLKLEAQLEGSSKTYSEQFDSVVVATGGVKGGYALAKALGHTVEPCVPSLFTFEISDQRLQGLSGISVSDAEVNLLVTGHKKLRQSGPLLITHWGLSGPAVITLSSIAARLLHDAGYQGRLIINWCSSKKRGDFSTALAANRSGNPKRHVSKYPLLKVPQHLWANLCDAAGINKDTRYAELGKRYEERLEAELFQGEYRLIGKGAFKEEFVTCGGVSLTEIDLRTMQSKTVPNLYFAGEVLNIDGLTGGFNFQAAWTTGYIAGESV